jgi:hypothetical protein
MHRIPFSMNLPPELRTITSPLVTEFMLSRSASVNHDTSFSELLYLSYALKLILDIFVNKKSSM